MSNTNKQSISRPNISHQATPLPSSSFSTAPVLTTGIVIPAISTDAMKTICENNEVPFAVLHFLRCAPLLVRVVHYQNQSLLRPANKLDFAEVQSMAGPNTNKISVPIVAAVYQTLDHTGTTSYTVLPPRNKFNTDLRNLTMYDQDTIFKMKASNAMPATKRKRPPAKVSTAPSRATNESQSEQPLLKKPMKSVQVAETKKRVLPNPLLISGPKPVVVQPVQPIQTTLEQEDTDISEAILMFATGSFLSPRRKKEKPDIKLEEHSDAGPSLAANDAETTTTNSSIESEDIFGSSFANFVTALQSDGYTADLEKIKEFFCANGLVGAEVEAESILP